MCGIFGSTDFERYKTLHKLNKDRGNFAYGCMYLQEGDDPIVQRSEGDSFQLEKSDLRYFMGHTQGPTSAQRSFNPDTSHPFNYLNWHVAHNGVLSNAKQLAQKYKVENPVDSAVIPVMIWNKFIELYDPDVWVWEREQRAIKLACEELEGTFSCWIHHRATNNIYLIRCGSTLFAGDREFSSAKTDGMEPLDDGSIYRLFHDADPGQSEWLRKVEEFKTSSPFFIL